MINASILLFFIINVIWSIYVFVRRKKIQCIDGRDVTTINLNTFIFLIDHEYFVLDISILMERFLLAILIQKIH